MDVNEAELPLEEQAPITTFQDYMPKPKPPTPMRYIGQLATLIGLTGAGLIVAGIASVIVLAIMKGGNFLSLTSTDIMKPGFANINKVLQIVTTLFLFFVPAFFFALIVNRKPLQYLGFNTKVSAKQLALVILIAFTGLFLSGVLGEINQLIPISKSARVYFQKLEDNYIDEILAMAQMHSVADYLLGLLIIALAPAILEEVFFRGALQNLLTRWIKKPWIAITITSIIFSLVHISYFGFLPRFMLGVVLGVLFYYSKNIWTNILAHFLNNAIAVTQIYMLSLSGKIDKKALADLDKAQASGWIFLVLGIISSIAMIAWLYFFKKESESTLTKQSIVNAENTFA